MQCHIPDRCITPVYSILHEKYGNSAYPVYIHISHSVSRLVNYHIFLKKKKKIPSEFAYIEVCFKNQNFNPLAIEDKINITLVIGQSKTYKKWQLFSSTRDPIFVKAFSL